VWETYIVIFKADLILASVNTMKPLLYLKIISLTPWSRTLLEKLTVVSQVIKKFPAFCETRRFITVLTRERQWPPSWARSTSHFIKFLRIGSLIQQNKISQRHKILYNTTRQSSRLLYWLW